MRRFLVCLGLWSTLAFSNETPQKMENWEQLRQQLRSTRNFRLGSPFNFKILDDGSRVLYQKAIPPSTAAAIYELSIQDGQEKKILTADMLAGGDGPVSAEEKALRERLRLLTTGINFYDVDDKGRWLIAPLKGKLFAYDLQGKKALEMAAGKSPIFSPKLSPDASHVAFVRDSNLFVTTLGDKPSRVTALTKGGTYEKSYGVAEFIAQEELDRRDGFWWAPDNSALLYQAVDQSKVERLSIADPFRPDAEPQRPYYPRPGQANAQVRFGFVPSKGGKTTWVDFSAFPHEYVSTVRWTKNGPPTFFLMNRLQTKAQLVSADPKTGKAKLLLTEADSAWVNVHAHFPLWLPDNKGFLWLSDRKGDSQLEWRDIRGNLVKVLGPKGYQVRDVLGVSKEGDRAFVEVTQDALHVSLMTLMLADGKATALETSVDGSVVAASDFKQGLYVSRSVKLDGSDQVFLKSVANNLAQLIPNDAEKPVMQANVSLQTIGPDAVQTAIIRPSNFKAGEKYPVVERVYGGPGSLMVRASGRSYLEDQVMADAMQAIIVRIDTRGTPDRGRDWERAISRSFGSLPAREHAEILKLLCQKFPELDAERIGIFGWSYGGYLAAYAVLARPDVYKAAVAGAPPVDFRDYDTAYTERYLGLPETDKKAYDTASLLPLVKEKTAKDNPRPMLIIHGTGDDNVFFFNSLKLVDALEREGLPYEFLPLMGMTHMVADENLDHRRFERTVAFFKAQLLRK